MTELKANTKRAKALIERYLLSNDCTLEDVYKSPSDNKRKAFQYCLGLQEELNGKNGRIVGHNSMEFSYMFEANDVFYYITKNNDYIIVEE